MDKIILIDGDGLCYKGIEDFDEYCDRIDEIITQIIVDTNSTNYRLFLEIEDNITFRKILNPIYKANRKAALPVNAREAKDYIIQTYNPFLSIGVETDDSIISTFKHLTDNYPLSDVIIAANDKDYLTYPINHYDLYYGRFGDMSSISKEEANYNFHKQLLTGDAVDNVKGIKGMGSKGAEKVLSLSTPSNYFLNVCRAYKKAYKGKWKDQVRLNYLMLKLRDDIRPCKVFDKVEFI